ncbi:hypothetical protein K503DRAFT_693704, partial [Rhizopogon vinicolor AM-OR11-026]
KKFRFQCKRQGNAVIVINISKVALQMVVDEEYNNISIKDLVEGTIVMISELYCTRKLPPDVGVNLACRSQPINTVCILSGLHASALLDFQRVARAEANKTIEIRDAEEGLTKHIVDDLNIMLMVYCHSRRRT